MKVYIGGLIMIGIGALLIPFIGSSSKGIIFVRILQALGTGPIMVSVLPIAAGYFPPKQRSILIVVQGLAVVVGIQIGLVCMPRIFQTTGSWQTAMAWLAPICSLGLIFSLICALSSKQPEEEISKSKTPFKEFIKIALLKPVTWVVVVCLVMYTWCYQAFNDLIPAYLNAADPVGLGYDRGSSGSLMSASSWIMICGGFTGVLITEKFLKGNARPVVLSGFILAAIFIYLIHVPTMASNHMILGISVCAFSFFSAFIQPQALGYITKYYPKHIMGTIGGLAMGISGFVGMAGVTAGSKAMQISGGFQMSLNIMVGVAVIGALAAIFLKPVKKM
jgi:hypothetical protein